MSNKKVAVITGASSGIGAATALEFARQGYRVALFARRLEKLEALKTQIEKDGGEARVAACDVTDASSLSDAVRGVLEAWGGIDIVLANAGFGVGGPLSQLTVEDYRRQFETNVFGVLNTIYATKEALVRQKGILAVVGSVAGQIPLPFSTAYGMSKFAVRALTLGLRGEMKRKGVSVVLVSPGFVDTDIIRVDNEGRQREKAVKEFPKFLVVPAAKAARSIVKGILSRKAEVVITTHGKVFIWVNRMFPKLIPAMSARLVTKSA